MKAIRIGICALAAFSVLAHGVVEPWSEAVLESGAAILLLLWAWLSFTNPDLKLVWNPLMWPLIGLWIVSLLQLLVGSTVYPFLTQIELLKYTALISLFFLGVQSFRTREQWHGLVWFLLTLGFAVSLFGILQHFTFNGKLYWVRELRYGGIPFGPYVNRNHFAGLMELLIPTGLSILILRAERRDQLPLVVLFSLLPVGALFLSASRGGITGLLAEIGILVILIIFRRRQKKEFLAGALILVLGAVLVSWLGIGAALDRFVTYKNLEVSESRRVEMVSGTWHIFLDHPILGTGMGTLQEVYPLYEKLFDGNIVNHTHNDYAETLSDAGILGGICGAAFLILLFGIGWKILSTDREIVSLAFHAGAFTACCGLLVHAFVDFNFHIPSNALIFLLQAALTTTIIPEPREQQRS